MGLGFNGECVNITQVDVCAEAMGDNADVVASLLGMCGTTENMTRVLIAIHSCVNCDTLVC